MQKPSYMDTHGEFEYRKKLNECGYRGYEIDRFFKLFPRHDPPTEDWAIELAKRGVKTADFILVSWKERKLDEMLELKELVMRMGYSEIDAERIVSEGIEFRGFADFIRAGFYPSKNPRKLFTMLKFPVEYALEIADELEKYGYTKEEAKDEAVRFLGCIPTEIIRDKQSISSLKSYIAKLKDEGIHSPASYKEYMYECYTSEHHEDEDAKKYYIERAKEHRDIGFSDVKAEWLILNDVFYPSRSAYKKIVQKELYKDTELMNKINSVKLFEHMKVVLQGLYYEDDIEALMVLVENMHVSKYMEYKLRKAGYPEDFIEALVYYELREIDTNDDHIPVIMDYILQFAEAIKNKLGIENFVKVYSEAHSAIDPFVYTDIPDYLEKYDAFSPITEFSEFFELGIKDGWMIRHFVDNGITAQELKFLMSKHSIPHIYEVVLEKGREGLEELARKIAREKTVSLFKRKS